MMQQGTFLEVPVHHEEFMEKMEDPYYYLYDKRINDFLNNFLSLWKASLSFGHKYRYNGYNAFIFCMGDSRSADDSTLPERMEKVQVDLYKAFNALLTEIRENWLEIDLDECSRTAREDYIEYHKRGIELI
jgi:hypothetical protein